MTHKKRSDSFVFLLGIIVLSIFNEFFPLLSSSQETQNNVDIAQIKSEGAIEEPAEENINKVQDINNKNTNILQVTLENSEEDNDQAQIKSEEAIEEPAKENTNKVQDLNNKNSDKLQTSNQSLKKVNKKITKSEELRRLFEAKMKNTIEEKTNYPNNIMIIKDRTYIEIDGPPVTLTLKEAPAKDAILYIAQLANYGFVFLPDNDSRQQSAQEISTVTLSLYEEEYEKALNSILLASGLQAKLDGRTLMVGKNVSTKSFAPLISKLYQLKQASASSAADYLASLGAAISKVSTSTVSSTDAMAGPGQDLGNEIERKKSVLTNIQTYGSNVGPLIGLTGTTDLRLQTITLVGEPSLIKIAEQFLDQIDLRQKQVALNVKILDVNFTNSKGLDNNFAFRTDNAFIVSDSGKLVGNYGSMKPPGSDTGGSPGKFTAAENTLQNVGEGVVKELQSATPFQFPKEQLLNYLTAQITSTDTTVLASPTLILSESSEVTSAEGSDIGRKFANEGVIRVGNQVVSSYSLTTDENGSVFCEPSFTTSGISLGAKLLKVDYDGYVTFVIEPTLSAQVGSQNQGGCGTINTVNERVLESGAVRVKDGHTLILTGVISDSDRAVITKWPIVGDIPLIGMFFRNTSNAKEKRELVILVTPKIISDENERSYVSSYMSKTKEIKKLYIPESKSAE